MRSAFAGLLLAAAGAAALRVEGDVTSPRPWQFIGWFTFDRVARNSKAANETYISWTFDGPADQLPQMVLFNDMPGSWGTAGPLLTGDAGGLSDEEVCRKVTTVAGGSRFSHTAARRDRLLVPDGVRPRLWYLFVFGQNCTALRDDDGDASAPVSFDVRFRNAGGFFRQEFGVDRQWVLETIIAALAATAALGAAYLVAVQLDKACDEGVAFHPIMKHFVATLVLQGAAYSFMTVDYVKLAATGTENRGLLVCGLVLDQLATLMLLLLIIVFAMGFKIVVVQGNDETESVQRRRYEMAVVLAVLLALHIVLVIAQTRMAGWSAEYPYATWPGVALAVLRVPILAYFAYTLHVTYALRGGLAAAPKRVVTSAGIFAAQIATLPAMLIVAVAVDPWVRFKVVVMADTLLKLVGLATMAVLLWPGARTRELLSSGYSRIALANVEDDDTSHGLCLHQDNDEEGL